jgi:hypothetical protein
MGHLAPWPDESDEMWRVGAGGGHQPGMGHRPRQGAGRDARIAALRPPTVRPSEPSSMGSVRATFGMV